MARRYSPNHPAVRHLRANTPIPRSGDVRARTDAMRIRMGLAPRRNRTRMRATIGTLLVIASVPAADNILVWGSLFGIGAILVVPVINRATR